MMREMWMRPAPDGDITPIKTHGSLALALAITTIATSCSASFRESRCISVTLHASLVPSAADQITAAIRLAGGAIPFSEFMRLALYDENGFYANTGRAGRRGDFITSPEVGPLFGTVIARALDAWWRELGEPAEFTVVDAGAEPGTLARSVLAAEPECIGALRYVAVEVSESQRTLHPAGIESRATMPDHPVVGVVVANELLDNLPFELFVFDGGWKQAFVGVSADGRFSEVLLSAAVPSFLPMKVPHGARVPVQTAATEWVGKMLGLIDRGRLWSSITALPRRRNWPLVHGANGCVHFVNTSEAFITWRNRVIRTSPAKPSSNSSCHQHQRVQAEFLRHWGSMDCE